MKKILYYIQLPPPIYGVTLVNKQVFESEIINKSVKKELIKVNFSKTLTDLKKINLKKIVVLISLWFKLLYKLIKFRPKYVYYTLPPTGIGFYKELPNIFILKLLKVKPIFHLHGKGIAGKVTTNFQKRLYRYCFSDAVIIHLSKGLYELEFRNIVPRNTNFFAVANGVETVNVSPAKKKSTFVELLFLSNLQESKGFFMLLEVLAKVVLRFPNIRLNIIGGFRDENSKVKFENFVRTNKLDKFIKFWGPKYDLYKHQIISNCDILIHPSFNDAFPLVILEAMQHGLAIIASDQGAIPEIIKPEFGCVFPTGEKEKLLFYVEKLISDKEKRKEMQVNSKNEFFKNYTLEHFETRMVNVFNHL